MTSTRVSQIGKFYQEGYRQTIAKDVLPASRILILIHNTASFVWCALGRNLSRDLEACVTISIVNWLYHETSATYPFF